MKFRRPFEPHDAFVSCSGETKKPVYTLVNKNGERSLKQVDEIDIPASINSYKESTDIRAILKRYSLTGDQSLLVKQKGGIYGDFTHCETNYAKLLDASRQLALLDLQAVDGPEEVSQEGTEQEGSVSDPIKEVTNE